MGKAKYRRGKGRKSTGNRTLMARRLKALAKLHRQRKLAAKGTHAHSESADGTEYITVSPNIHHLLHGSSDVVSGTGLIVQMAYRKQQEAAGEDAVPGTSGLQTSKTPKEPTEFVAVEVKEEEHSDDETRLEAQIKTEDSFENDIVKTEVLSDAVTIDDHSIDIKCEEEQDIDLQEPLSTIDPLSSTVEDQLFTASDALSCAQPSYLQLTLPSGFGSPVGAQLNQCCHQFACVKCGVNLTELTGGLAVSQLSDAACRQLLEKLLQQ